MMKSTLHITRFLLFSSILVTTALGQITSIRNGDWDDPNTWDCLCVPAPTDDVIVDHDVRFDINKYTHDGSVTVNSGARLYSAGGNRNLNLSSTGELYIYGDFEMGKMENEGDMYIYSSGVFDIGGNFNNQDGYVNNAGTATVDGNLQNQNGVLTGGCGVWIVDGNAINAAGGLVNGCLNFESPDVPCADPFIPAGSGTMDSTNISICGSALILPVELLVFKAQAIDNDVALSWTTALEHNNDRFEILRSEDGRQFDVVGTVGGSGTTNRTVSYAYTDVQPGSGRFYYRLRQVDYDGTFTNGEVRQVSIGSSDQPLSVYHAAGTNEIRLAGRSEHPVKVSVFGTTGQLLASKTYASCQGRRTLHLPENITGQVILVRWESRGTGGTRRFFTGQ